MPPASSPLRRSALSALGQFRGVDHDGVNVGQQVEISVGRNGTEGERLVVFEPA